jgi:hypothetical protein
MLSTKRVINENNKGEINKVINLAAEAVSDIPEVVDKLIDASMQAGFDRRKTERYLADVATQIVERYINLLEAIENTEAKEVERILQDESLSYEEKMELFKSVKEIGEQNLDATEKVFKLNNRMVLIIVGGAVCLAIIINGSSVLKTAIRSSASIAKTEIRANAISKFSLAAVIETVAGCTAKGAQSSLMYH